MGINPYSKENRGNFQDKGYRATYPPRQPPQDRRQSQCSEQKDALDIAIEKINGLNRMSDLDVKEFAGTEDLAAKVAQEMKYNIKTSQLRKFFDPLVKIEDDLNKKKSWNEVEGRLYMVLPTLAYAVGRNLAPKKFYNLIEACIKKVLVQGASPQEKTENFKRFMEFLRSIVAYNKYFGGD